MIIYKITNNINGSGCKGMKWCCNDVLRQEMKLQILDNLPEGYRYGRLKRKGII